MSDPVYIEPLSEGAELQASGIGRDPYDAPLGSHYAPVSGAGEPAPASLSASAPINGSTPTEESRTLSEASESREIADGASEQADPIALVYNKASRRAYPGLPAQDLTVSEVLAWVQTAEYASQITAVGIYTPTEAMPILPGAAPAAN